MKLAGLKLGMAAGACLALQACGMFSDPYPEMKARLDEQPIFQAMKVGDPEAYAKVDVEIRSIAKLPEDQRVKAMEERVTPILQATLKDHLANVDNVVATKIAAEAGTRLMQEADKPGMCDVRAGVEPGSAPKAMQIEVMRMKPVREAPVVDPASYSLLMMEIVPGIARATGWSPQQVMTALSYPDALDGDAKCRVTAGLMIALSDISPDRSGPVMRTILKRQAAGR